MILMFNFDMKSILYDTELHYHVMNIIILI